MNKTSSEEKKKSLLESKRPRLPLNLEDLPGLINEDFPPLTQDKVRRRRSLSRRRRSLSRSRSLSPSTNTWTKPPQVSDLEAFSSPARSSTSSHLESLSRPTSKFRYRPSTPYVAAILNTSETNNSVNLSDNVVEFHVARTDRLTVLTIQPKNMHVSFHSQPQQAAAQYTNSALNKKIQTH
jgi:hypothetical protein